jgi:hypothetical protein
LAVDIKRNLFKVLHIQSIAEKLLTGLGLLSVAFAILQWENPPGGHLRAFRGAKRKGHFSTWPKAFFKKAKI